jgi:hypothetical protein
MPQLKKTQIITKARRNFSENLDENGIIPITRDGKFSAVLISVGELGEKNAQRLFELLKRNSTAGIEMVRRKALTHQ